MNMEDIKDIVEMKINLTAENLVNDLDELINTMVISGASNNSIQRVLKNDLKDSGRIFGAFKNKSKAVIANGIENTSNVATVNGLVNAGVKRFMWVAAGTNICIDCADRAGETGTLEFFDLIGHPKS